jgi:hypothetical protein
VDSRDILIIGAVAVAAFLYFRNSQTTVPLPMGAAGAGAGAMTASAAKTTTPALPSFKAQLGTPVGGSFGGFSSVNMGGSRFVGSTAIAIVTDAIPPTPVTHPPVQNTPNVVGGAATWGFGASSMGPQPVLTRIVNPVRY